MDNLPPLNVGSIINYTFSDLLKQPNWELLVAVDHNQLQTMALETVGPIVLELELETLQSNLQPQHAKQPPCLCGRSGTSTSVLFLLQRLPSSALVAPCSQNRIKLAWLTTEFTWHRQTSSQ